MTSHEKQKNRIKVETKIVVNCKLEMLLLGGASPLTVTSVGVRREDAVSQKALAFLRIENN